MSGTVPHNPTGMFEAPVWSFLGVAIYRLISWPGLSEPKSMMLGLAKADIANKAVVQTVSRNA